MSIDFGPVPFPESPIYDYFERRCSRSLSGTTASSPLAPSSFDEKVMQDRSLEFVESQRVTTQDLSRKDEDDIDSLLESQSPSTPTIHVQPPEYRVPLRRKLTFLGLYFFLNIALTLSNKDLLIHVKTPWLLTVMHATATSIGCWMLVATGGLKLSSLGGREQLILLAFSSLFTMNIAASNISLAVVSVPFHQVMRSTCPVVTAIIYRTVFKRSYDTQTYLSMIPLIVGVGLATLGDYSFTPSGFVLTLLGVVLASVKTVTTNRLMTGSLALSPLELLTRMSPLAAVQCLFYAIINGELQKFDAASSVGDISSAFVVSVIGNASVAFLLNSVSFQTNKLAGALTMSICGNIKQCLTIALGISLFSVKLTTLNVLGMCVAVFGAAWYSRVELRARS